MADNVLKGVIDAIAESDNEVAGQLITRLREAHEFGRDDGELAVGTPTRLISPVDIFTASDVGKGVDLLEPVILTATGNEGSYLVGTFIDAKNITLTKVDASAPSFTTQKPVRWRFTTLRVETTLDFKERDRQMQLWVGAEPAPTVYAELVQTAGAQEFRGLGKQRLEVFGSVDAAATTTLSTTGAFFTAADVGKTVWILPLATPNGNEGPQLITAVAGDGKSATVSPGGLTTTETLLQFVIKDYDSDDGYLTGLRIQQDEVIDGSQSFSGTDQVRRAMLVDFASGEELDRIGRNLAVIRPFSLGDESFRCLLKTLSYLPKTTVYGIELVLACLFPGGGFSVYEDLIGFPNKVFILITALAGTSTVFEGKAFLAPTGKDITPPIDPAKAGGAVLGRAARERQTSSSTTAVTIAHTPLSVLDVLQEDDTDVLDMDVLPSADTPVWTFFGEADSAPIESDVFAIVATGPSANALEQTPDTPPSNDGGRYQKSISTDFLAGSIFEFEAWFKIVSHTTSGGFPWGLYVSDDSIDAQYGLWWNLTQIEFSESPGSGTFGPFDHGLNLNDGQWHQILLRRESVDDKHLITAFIDGKNLAGSVDSSIFATTTVDNCSFGYFYQSGTTQNWNVQWDNVKTFVRTDRNHWNVANNDGVFSGSTDNLTSASALFLAGDVGKYLRVKSRGTGGAAADVNIGLWKVKTFVSTSDIELEGFVSAAIASVSTVGSDNFITLLDPLFVPQDKNKQIEIAGSALGNDGARKILEYVSPKKVRVDGAAYVSEIGLTYKFNVFDGTTAGQFAAATVFTWELIDAASFVGPVLTLREALPLASTPVQIWYTSVWSAQILRNEALANEGSLGSEPGIFYPFYVFDVDRATRQLLDEITAAGVLPAYEREF